MPALPTGTVTFLFTDIEGSTRLLNELGAQGYAQALTEHRRVMRAAIARHGGAEVDTQGDAFFVAFGDARHAAAAAVEAVRDLAAGPIRIRAGIHTGNPHVDDGGYVGADVHLGARIAAAGHGGQVLLSKAARELLDDEVTDLGEHRLKDFAAPVWIYQLGAERFPPLRTISNTNVPRPASSLVGRGREVSEVADLLRDGTRLVTLTGPGGTGKSRLAIAAAIELIPSNRNGVFWVALAALTDPGLVMSQVAQVLGAREGVAEHIGEREMLLVIDNFEQVVDAAPQLPALLGACPNLRLLVTSRQRLRVSGEVEYVVPPLAESEAVELFSARSGVVADETVSELCRRLDNLPLAVELAAARCGVLSPTQIVARLSQRLDLLQGGRDADARQKTLRATIEWSHDALSADEKTLFARLAVFQGGCTLDAAEQVVEADLDTLQSLVDKSLVRHTGDRFWMLETIREYAVEQLDVSIDCADARRRHAQYFLDLVQLVRTGALSDSKEWSRLEEEQDNLRAALAWVIAAGDRSRGLDAIRWLWHFWIWRGLVAEGDSWARQLLAMPGATDPVEEGRARILAGELARFSGDLRRAAQLKIDGLERIRGRLDELQGAAARDVALILLGLGDIDGADRYAAEALSVRRRLGIPDGIAHALEGRAHVEWARGDVPAALALLGEAVSLLADEATSEHLSGTLQELAEMQRRSGNARDAATNLSRALRIAVESGDTFILAYCLREAGSLMATRGQFDVAARIWGALGELVRETGLSFAEDPSDFEIQERRVRDGLGAESYAQLYGAGAAMTRPEVEAFVLSAVSNPVDVVRLVEEPLGEVEKPNVD
jgi:predicted ATPase